MDSVAHADRPPTHLAAATSRRSLVRRQDELRHSRDGRFVYGGDAGDVIDTATRKSVAYLAPLANTRKCLEIDWANGRPVFATSRFGVGSVTKPH